MEKLLDTQFVNDHLKQFGVYEVRYDQYMMQLQEAVSHKAHFDLDGLDISENELVREYFEMRKTAA